ncbi:MAG TPA: extracellular solute-binding protein [Solirubrobacteraceae bacterium]|jgi:ABC-type glycerol-3-phosphate transport system substrate-binding protein
MASASAKATDNPYAGTMTYWWWGESDAPGANNWMQSMIGKYEKLHPKVHINLVPQGDATLEGAFTSAAATKSGPDIATQFATLPTLTPAWNGDIAPISDYVPKSEWSNWIDTQENMWDGKLWAMPLYLLGSPMVWNKHMFRQAGLNPNQPPTNFQQLLSDCHALKAKGITPIAVGNKDGYIGSSTLSWSGKGDLTSLKALLEVELGKQPASSQLSTFYSQFAKLQKHGCFNDDIASLGEVQGWQLFPQKKGAMTFSTDGFALQAEKILGAKNIGVAAPPNFGNGPLAKDYDATQSSDEFITSWSHHKREAAAFLVWLHKPANLDAWYKDTRVFPADKRFPASKVTDPIAKQLYKLDVKPSIWLENYLPPEIDGNGSQPGGELITAGSGTPAQAIADWTRAIQEWKLSHLDEFRKFQVWANGF